ncbi:MAG: hypothetical protein HYY97_16000 [Rhodocyclales bacterium]|nr:hypothetical protein [Rhodocyclales bacterium]
MWFDSTRRYDADLDRRYPSPLIDTGTSRQALLRLVFAIGLIAACALVLP